MIRYWWNPETDEYDTSINDVEADNYASLGYEEIDRIEFDQAMRALK